MSSSTKTYDVFISFRGEDTRTNFTSHLYSALRQANIRTYIDDNLKKGDELWPTLSYAIQDSHIAIVVFSENYASSKWCLEELVKILQCRKDNKHRQVVIPVFHEVDPSDVRKQTGSYREAFAKHERLFCSKDNESIQNKVSEWKAALAEAANISGWDSRNRDYKNDSLVIEKIVEDVMQKLYLRYPIELEVEGLVGIDKICEYIEYLLSINKHTQLLKNVKVIGIWGMGGIGKTTSAKAVFSQLFPQYDSVCFLANVREESKRLGQTSLCDKLLFDLLKEENPKSNPIGSTFIARRLSSKKVFVVLDDVDNLDQLDDLCRVYKYAGPDSKLIITTRNRHLLSGRVDEIYKAKVWSFDESLELFCLHAFKQRCPQKGYEDLSKTAVDYAGGVPLALKVLGSNLYSRSTKFWDSELKKLKNYPYDKIQNVLQVSYDGLDIPQQKIFLDIAFFFKDEDKGFVERVLNACDFSATSGVEVLEDKALITVSKGQRIQMHDLLQEMGLNIVRQGIEDPGKRSRLRDIEEISDVFKNKKKGSDAVEGITLDLSRVADILSLSADTFNMMINLRFLKLFTPSDKRAGKVDYPRDLNKISDKLRYLEWHGYRLKYLPSTFSAKMLVEIRMPHSHVIELWRGVQDVVNLEGIDLSECKQLKKLPDLSKAPKLKWLNLTGCERLLAIHPSVLSLDTIEKLILDRCKKLKNLKSEKHLGSLKKFSVNGCTSLKEFSLSSSLIERLDLSNTEIQKLHSSIGNSVRLKSLNLEGLRLKNLPNELSFLKSLWDLRISNCSLVLDKQKLHTLFDGLRRLAILHLKDCCNLFELPDNINNLSDLRELILDGSSVEKLPENIKHLEYMEILSLNNCSKFRCIPALPLDTKIFDDAKRGSLMDATAIMRGEKYISFQNCMKLDERSLDCIIEGIQLIMMSIFFHNKYVGSFHGFSDNPVKVCLPGNRVPRQFTYQTTESSITITNSSKSMLLGIILCAVLSPSEELKKHGASIWCQLYWADGEEVGPASTWHHKAITGLNSDHVYIWCHSLDRFVRYNECQISFKFYVTNDTEEPEVLNIGTKECGVQLVFYSEDLCRLLQGMYSESGTDEKEWNGKNNQLLDLSDNCSCSCDCLFDVLRHFWRLFRT